MTIPNPGTNKQLSEYAKIWKKLPKNRTGYWQNGLQKLITETAPARQSATSAILSEIDKNVKN